jgi:hypothetical protein
VGAYAAWASSASATLRQISVKGDATVFQRQTVGAIANEVMYQSLTAINYFSGLEQIKLEVLQKSGGALNITEATLWVMKL